MPSRYSELPPPGVAVGGIAGLTRAVKRLGEQAASAATVDASGLLCTDQGATGLHMSPAFQSTLACFEIQTCWRREQDDIDFGATHGRNWVCYGMPVGYWLQATDNHLYWRSLKQNVVDNPDLRRIPLWWPETSEQDAETWQKVLYPLYGVGQWVWATYDYSAAVWRVIHAYDDVVRIKLKGALAACDQAEADVMGYPCRAEGSSSSSGSSVSSGSSGSSGSSSESSSVPPSSSSSAGSAIECDVCVEEPCDPSDNASGTCSDPSLFSRGTITVYDPLGLVYSFFPDGSAPEGTTGWAKRCADSERFEVVSLAARQTAITSNDLVECCLCEDHPGYGKTFHVWVADRWDSANLAWFYIHDRDHRGVGIDWRYGTPYPAAGARGLFKARASDKCCVVYECVSLDCVSPGACAEGALAAEGCCANEGSSSSYGSGQ